MVFTIKAFIFLSLNFATKILDVSFGHVHTVFIGGRYYRFDNVKVAGKSVIVLECKDFTSWRRGILVYELGMMEGKRGDRFKCIHGIIVKSVDKQVET